MLLGLALLVAEMMRLGGFYILFFGLSALTVGTMIRLGLVEVV
jgi:membrane protein implicated in regulation of membrane protease activity